MEHINNDPDHILIRKSQNTLIVVGSGTILFSIWTAVKVLSSLFLLRTETVASVRKLTDLNDSTYSDKMIFIITLVIYLIIVAIFVAFRTYVGRAAIAEGIGRRRRRGYLVIAVIMIVMSMLTIINNLRTTGETETALAIYDNTSFSSLIIELTSMIMLIEMVSSAVKIRAARRRVSESAVQKDQV